MSDPVPPVVPQPEYSAPTYPPQPPQPQFGPPPTNVQPNAQGMYLGAGSLWSSQVRPLRGIGGVTRGLILVSAVLALGSIILEGWGIVTLDAYSLGSVGIGALQAHDSLSVLVGIVSLVVLVASGICWVVWQYRAAASLPVGVLRRSPGWHAGSWFIPFAGAWIPFQNISDLARGSRAALGGGTRAAWWALWIMSGLTGGIASRLLTAAETVPSLTGALTISILSDVLSIAAAIFAWIVVARITDAIDPAYR